MHPASDPLGNKHISVANQSATLEDALHRIRCINLCWSLLALHLRPCIPSTADAMHAVEHTQKATVCTITMHQDLRSGPAPTMAAKHSLMQNVGCMYYYMLWSDKQNPCRVRHREPQQSRAQVYTAINSSPCFILGRSEGWDVL